ncbi:flagellar assembly protein A [Dehalobacter sp. TBBPA1]|uniref:flagellar assembly protein A n=1 Tax=Dehalobacter sp. TBBPA1 TaxID=3235037 RepID=UPI0034A4ACE2
MKEMIATGKTLEEIRERWSREWGCDPEALQIETIEKPGVFSRLYKVKVILPDSDKQNFPQEDTQEEDTRVLWDQVKYTIYPGSQVQSIVPYPHAGKLFMLGNEIGYEMPVNKGDTFEFYPLVQQGGLSWGISVEPDGSKAVARVRHARAGKFVLANSLPNYSQFVLEQHVSFDASPEPDELPTEANLLKEINDKGIVYGIKSNLWADFMAVDGEREIVIAEATLPIPTVQPQLIDYVGEPVFQNEESNEDKIDYFACKIVLCQKDDILARKIPGKEGVPGTNIFGKATQVDKIKDFMITMKKNVYLTENMEVKASCSGTPVRVNKNTYLVENAFIQNKDVDLSTGSIDFPGDVFIGGNVTDGLYIHSSGAVKVQGSVSGADIKAETGLAVRNNIIASKILVGEKHVSRSEFIKTMQEVSEELALCVHQIEQLQGVSANTSVGQLFKVILEKNFQQLPKKVEELERLLNSQERGFVSPELDQAIRSVKHFMIGLGPLQLKDTLYLKNALKIVGFFMATKGLAASASVLCDVSYVQNSEISCAGDFFCHKGVYNSILKIEGCMKIHGVCRGGEISCSGDVYIWELGGSNISATTIKASKDSHINIEFCHANIKIFIGKELIKIDEPAQKVDIFRDKGNLQVGKLRWDGSTR